MPGRLPASWFDGVSARARPCELGWQDGSLLLVTPDAQTRRYAHARVNWPERTRHGQRQLLLPDGGVVLLPNARDWDAWAEAAGIHQPLAARWAMSWRGVMLALLLLVLTLSAAWRWGIPWGAEQLARWVPTHLQAALGDRVMSSLEQRGWLQDSELPPEAQQRIVDAVGRMTEEAYRDLPMPSYTLRLRKAPAWLGPNAFTLPGGTIVVTDALVLLLDDDSVTVNPALLGVVAHELGHVRARHGLRLLFEAGAMSAITGWWIGDYSALLAGAPALAAQAGYSREHERAADAEALRVMRASGIDPRAMLSFFEALKKAMPQRDGNATAFGLASHPADSERIKMFQDGARSADTQRASSPSER